MKINKDSVAFLIEESNLHSIYLKFRQSKKEYKAVDGIISIPFDDIYMLTDGRASILMLQNEAGEEVLFSDELTSFSSEKMLTEQYQDTLISIYPSKEKTLRLLVGELPISHRFIEKVEFTFARQLRDGSVEVAIDLDTLMSHATEGDLFFTFRGSIEKTYVSTTKVEKLSVEDHIFRTRLFFKIRPVDMAKVREFDGYSNYFNNIIDLSLMFQLESNYLFARRHRVCLEHDYEEYFVQEHPDILTGVKFYQTMNEKSSIILEDIPLESKECFNLESNMGSSDRLVALFCEYPEKAQDTAFSQFKYMSDELSDQFECWYIIEADSPDLVNLEPYKDQVIIYKEPLHFEKFMQADMIFHSHSSMYANPTKMKKFQDKMEKTFRVFLQHGILGVRDLSYMYAKGDKTFTNLFICSSEREKNIIMNDYFYSEDEIGLTGLSRFDELFNKYQELNQVHANRQESLLIFPSWRKGENRLSDEKFMDTSFYKEFQSLLNDDTFIDLLKANHVKAKFLLHPNFSHYRHLFTSDYIDTDYDNYILQDELVKNDYLLTDFSSAALDFALLKKPVIYYQFDKNLAEAKKDNNLKAFLPGDIIKSRRRLYRKLKSVFKKKQIKKKHEKKLDNLSLYRDNQARERIVVKAMEGYEKNNICRGSLT